MASSNRLRTSAFVLLLSVASGLALPSPARAQEEGAARQPVTREALLEAAENAPDAEKPDRWVALANFLDREGSLFDAAHAWGQARRLRGDRSDAEGEARILSRFAEQVLQSGDAGAVIKAAFVDARIALERARKLGADGDWVGVGLARCAAALGNTEDQVRILEETLAQHPASVPARRALAFAHYHAGNDAEAGGLLDGLIRNAETDVLNLSLTRCVSARRAGDEAAAVAAASRAIHAAPDDGRGWLALWQIYKDDRRFGELADRMTALVAAHPTSPQGAHYTGFACSYAGRTDAALEWLDRAVERSETGNVAAHLEVARLLREVKKDVDGAVARYRTVLELSPGNSQAVATLSYMARMLSDRDGRPEAAVPLFRMIAESQGDDGLAWADLALALRWAGHSEESLETYRKAIEHAPEDAQVANDMGLLLLVMGRDDEAGAAFQAAHEADDRHNDGLENLGFMAREKADPAAAEKWFDTAWRAALARGEDGARHRRNLDDVRNPLPPLR